MKNIYISIILGTLLLIMLTECLVVVTLPLAVQCMVAKVVAISNLFLFVATVVSDLLAETCIPSTELPP